MYPFDQKEFRPAISPNGKYVFRMLFNGCYREVTIDDRLPSSSPSRALFVVDQRNPRLIWPALMEKAYLKIRGGYDFPGSNSGTDLYVLTGWIPEQRFLRHDESDLDRTWDAMKNAYDAGNVVLTLGTSYLSPEEEETLGLVSEHDYAVMDLDENAGIRRMLVKNPWRNSVVWTGIGSSASMDVIASSPSLPAESTAGGGGSVNGQTGTFWMPFDDVIQNFDSLYLNWNPALFTHRQDHHFRWELPRKVDANALWHNPQFSLQSTNSEPVWILLSRHWKDSELDILRNGRNSDHSGRTSFNGGIGSSTPSSDTPTLASVSKTLGFMSVSIYAASPPGSRVYLPDYTPLHRSTFVDSPNTLVRIERPDPRKTYTVVVTQADLPLPEYSFTLSFFSTTPLTIKPAPSPLGHITFERGDWTRRTAGGNIESPTYHTNPQFALTIPPSAGAGAGTRIYLALTTSADDLPIHVALLHSDGGGRVTSASNRRRDIIASSPEYRRGAASASTFSSSSLSSSFSSSPSPSPSTLVPPGTYTIVASTFEPGQLARFNLAVMADAPVSLRPISSDTAGRFSRALDPLPLIDHRGRGRGCHAPVFLSRLTRLRLAVRRAAGSATAIATTMAGPASGSGNLDGLARALAQSYPTGDVIAATSSSTSSLAADGSAPCAVRVSLELGRGPGRTVLAVTGEGEFADVPPAGLQTRDVDVERGDGRGGGLWVVVERIGGHGGGVSAPAVVGGFSASGGGGGGGGNGGAGGGVLEVDLLSDANLAVGNWEYDD